MAPTGIIRATDSHVFPPREPREENVHPQSQQVSSEKSNSIPKTEEDWKASGEIEEAEGRHQGIPAEDAYAIR
jgi:hypothetical protein